ncbi:IS3 family transposase [Laribacter hongkongensis]|nr:IS3 family transposase [Laribacter hongkongensis]
MHALLRPEGWAINHKWVERIYKQEGLSLRLRRRKKWPSHLRMVLSMPEGEDQRWAMDFVPDTLWNGCRIRALTVVDT